MGEIQMSRRRYEENEIEHDEEESRGFDERISEQRDRELRAINQMGYINFYDMIPKEEIPEGMVYRGVRVDTLGQPDTGREMEALQFGWRPVPAKRHPRLAQRCFINESPHQKNYIYYKGTILMEREKVYDDIQMNALRQRTAAQLNSVPGIDGLMGEPTMPGSIRAHQTSTSRSPSFG